MVLRPISITVGQRVRLVGEIPRLFPADGPRRRTARAARPRLAKGVRGLPDAGRGVARAEAVTAAGFTATGTVGAYGPRRWPSATCPGDQCGDHGRTIW